MFLQNLSVAFIGDNSFGFVEDVSFKSQPRPILLTVSKEMIFRSPFLVMAANLHNHIDL
jgi:hypothetical protein